MMNKSKGFTIIELIVVIAIVAILAAIVLVNVTGYINKANDARIRSDLGNIALGMATCYALANPNYYTGCMASTDYIPGNLLTDIEAANGVGNFVYTTSAASQTVYAACSPLASDAAKYVCIDSTGITRDSATACTASSTVCP